MGKMPFDEMQEQRMLHIEKTGCAIAWWGLLIALMGQWALYGRDFSRLGGEMAVFLPLTLYLGMSSLRNGLPDRAWPASLKAKAGVSLSFGAAVAALHEIAVLRKAVAAWANPLWMFMALLLGVSAFSFLALLFLQALLARRRRSLDREGEDGETE